MKNENMKNQKCESIMERFLQLDKNERLPLSMTLHLLKCKKCRTQVHYLTLAEKYASKPLQNKSLKEILENMSAKPVSLTKWIIWGILMIFLMITFGIFLNKIDRTSFAIIFNVMFGVMVTVYCALFVGTNIEYFIKTMSPHGSGDTAERENSVYL